MIPHPRVLQEQLDPEQVEAVYAASLRILETAGLAVSSAEARDVLAGAGARIDAGRVTMAPDLVERCLALAPRKFTLHGRNPARTVELGTGSLLISPGYGSPSIADARGRRRDATLADFESFASLAGRSECIDITGGLLVEPLNVPAALRALETTAALLERSDKPFLGSVAGAAGASDSLRLAEIVFGKLGDRAVTMGLVNINSPLRLDGRMAEALLAYARAGQAVLLTPGILLGVTAPVTSAGALAQAMAELLGCVVLAEGARRGTPVVIGTGGFGSDLRTGGPGFGRPENALGTILGAQLARRIGLPFRCSGSVTGSRLPDCRSGQERMLTAMAAWTSGAHLCLQAAGTLDSINSMSYEQFVIDLEMWTGLRRLALPPEVSAETLAVDLIVALLQDYLGADHTVEHMSSELAALRLATPKPYEEWMADGAPDIVALASRQLGEGRPGGEPMPLDPACRREIRRLVDSRRKELA
jgi:trimethylamine--corrinoid protein Co-methyltransferase